MGSEIAQWEEWNADGELQWDLLQWESHGGIKQMLSDLNSLVLREKALHEVDFDPAGFEWIDCHSRGGQRASLCAKSKGSQ